MKKAGVLGFAAASLAGQAKAGSPIGKVLEMIGDLQSKIIAEGEQTQRTYAEFSEWCEERAKELMFEVKTGKKDKGELEAVIDEETSIIESLTTKVDELTAKLSSAEKELKDATTIRKKEKADFEAEEKESEELIDTLSRAVHIIEKEMKGGASMMQLKGVKNLASVFSALVQASALNAADGERLAALVQTTEAADDADADDDTSAPAASTYDNQSGGILETLQGLLDKSESQLEESRKKEQDAIYAFEAFESSLKDKISVANRNIAKSKQGMAKSGEKKATAQGDLDVTAKDLHSDEATLSGIHHDCMSKASEFETETKSRNEELKALANAKKIIKEATSLNQVSFMQLGSDSSSMDFRAVRFVRKLAKEHNDPALTQLSARMATAIRHGSKGGADPFAKIKGLIRDMISKLEKDAEEAAGHKQYCDKEMGETKVKHEDKTAEIDKLTTSVEEMTAQSAKLKEEVATLQKELSDIAHSQSDMDRIRNQEHEDFVAEKAELDKGLNGITLALKVLNEYYGNSDGGQSAAGGGIIDLLETVQSDFEKSLAEVTEGEESAQAEYDAETKQNAMETTVKTQDVKYKTVEATDLDKALAETNEDLTGAQSEIAAVNEYWAQIKEECIEKVPDYAEKVKRRNAEIAGLKEALEAVSGSAVFLQVDSTHRLRGPLRQVHTHTSLA